MASVTGQQFRGTSLADLGNLPRSKNSGEIIGVDLKKIKSKGKGKDFIMFVMVDFTSCKVWAFNMGKTVVAEEFHKTIAHWMTTILEDVPKVLWSDNETQFKTVLQEAYKMTLGVAHKFIPTATPRANGLTEVSNKFVAQYLARVEGDEAEKLTRVVLSYNNKTHSRWNQAPDVVFRILRPRTSTRAHLGLTQSLKNRGKMVESCYNDDWFNNYEEELEKWRTESSIAEIGDNIAEKKVLSRKM